jgi:L-rhamnose mutarotase
VQRFAFTMTVKPDRLREYVDVHRAVWPSVLDAIRRSGIQSYSIFLRGNQLFFLMEAEDPEAAMRYLDADPEHARWNRAVTGSMFEGRLDVGAPEGMAEVFRFEAG